jgi:hypothetical protein
VYSLKNTSFYGKSTLGTGTEASLTGWIEEQSLTAAKYSGILLSFATRKPAYEFMLISGHL